MNAKKPDGPAKAEKGKPTEKPALKAGKLLDAAERHLAEGDLDKAQQVLTEVRGLAGPLAKADAARLTQLETNRDEKRKAKTAAKRAQALAQAAAFLEQGKLEAATQALDEVAKTFPTEEERQASVKLKEKIEEHRRRRRELGIAMKLLGSLKKEDVRSARSRLAEDAEVAVPLLAEALQGKNQTLATNALESLRILNEPARALPAVVGVLSRESQSALWPIAVREIQKMTAPGGGPPLLKLVIESKNGAQRLAALTALASVMDPPPETTIALLPAIYQDGPELPTVLAAVRNAVIANRQFDLLARRGIDDTELTPEQEQQLNGLGARLTALSAEGVSTGSQNEAAQAAQTLGVLTRLLLPHPLTDIKVLRASAELPESPPAGVLDGIWNSVEPKTMWRHPVEKDKKVTIVLDLGTERTIAGIRIWNENEVGGRNRGWKDVEVYVASTTSSLAVSAKGVVPRAPGVADAADYGCLLNVPCVRGRYIRLECLNQWLPDGIGGISELQVIGF